VGACEEGRSVITGYNRMSGARITAVLSSFNRPDGLEASFRSVVEQTSWDRMELIVCDDASPDERVLELLGKMAERPRVTVLRGDPHPVEHKEVYCTFTDLINRALDRAEGEYVSYITDGNLWTPGRCEHYERHLDANPGVFLVWGMVQNVRDGRPIPMPPFNRMGMGAIQRQIVYGNFIDHGSVMHRRTPLRWSTHPQSWQFADWLFWKRLLAAGAVFDNVGFHGEVFNSDKDSLGRCLTERHETFKEMYRRRAGGGNGGAPEQARKEVLEMAENTKRVEYAKNVGTKIELVPRADGSGNDEVAPGDLIRKDRVTTQNGMLWDNFALFGEFNEYKPKEPASPKTAPKSGKRRRSEAAGKAGPKVPFERMRKRRPPRWARRKRSPQSGSPRRRAGGRSPSEGHCDKEPVREDPDHRRAVVRFRGAGAQGVRSAPGRAREPVPGSAPGRA